MQVEKNQILQALEKHFQEAIALSLDLSIIRSCPMKNMNPAKKSPGS